MHGLFIASAMGDSMIPKIIHYCWFGHGEKPQDVKKYLATWRAVLPEYEIMEWNESNFDVNICRFSREAYQSGKYAFVSDYARLYILYHQGGIYLDVDMELKKSLNPYLNNTCFLSYESERGGIASCIIGAECGEAHLKELMQIYEKMVFAQKDGKLNMRPNTQVIGDYLKGKYGEIWDGTERTVDNIRLYDWHIFHSLDLVTGKMYVTPETVAIHHHTLLWVSWKTRLVKFLRHKVFIPVFGEKAYYAIEKKRKR